MVKFAFVSFYTEGPPNDNGLSLGECLPILQKQVAPNVDVFKVYTLKELSEDPWWKQHFHNNQEPLQCNPGAHTTGYFKYKALIIYRQMMANPDDTIIHYMDGNVLKSPYYTINASEWRHMCEYVLNENGTDIWVGTDGPLYLLPGFTKTHTIRMIAPPDIDIERYFNAPLLLCCRIVVRNTPKMREWFNDLLKLFEDDSLLAPHPNDNPHPKFQFHTGDQGVWGTFLYTKKFRGELPEAWPKFWLNRRTFDMDNLRRI